MLAIGLMLTAGVAVQSTSQNSSSPGPLANRETAAGGSLQLAGKWLSRKTDHFDIYYPPDLDLHAERVWREAERAYERVSTDLRHNLAFHVPILLFRTTGELQKSTQADGFERTQATAATSPEGDRILLAVDQSADQRYGRIVHEVTHVFAFDILPGTTTPRWIMEGLAEYERAAWDPDDLVALRTAVRANAVPVLTAGRSEVNSRDARQIDCLGHAAFDFIESRWGKAGVRQFLFALRQSGRSGSDPFEAAFQIQRNEFDRTFAQYLRERFTAAADPSLVARFDYRATLQLEGEITGTRAPAEEGLACIELWVPTEGGARQRWGIECGTEPAADVVRGLKPGDRVIVTGPPARETAAQRMVVQHIERPSDGFTWHARSR